MNARTLSAGLVGVGLISLALGCEKGTPASTLLASRPAGLSPNFSASASNHHMRWDIISVDFGTGTVSAGGVASARANLDLSKITLTGSDVSLQSRERTGCDRRWDLADLRCQWRGDWKRHLHSDGLREFHLGSRHISAVA